MPLRFLLLISVLLTGVLVVVFSFLSGRVFLSGLAGPALLFFAGSVIALLLVRRRHTRIRISDDGSRLKVERHRLLRAHSEEHLSSEIAPPVLEWRFGGMKPAPERGKRFQPYELYMAIRTKSGVPLFVSRVWRTSEQGGVRLLVRRIYHLLSSD